LVLAKTKQKAEQDALNLSQTLKRLGFVINEKKSVLTPHQETTFLGFTINSVTMSIGLTKEKKQKTLTSLQAFESTGRRTIRDLAKLIGTLNALSPAMNYSSLFIRELIFIKNQAMNKTNGNRDATTPETNNLTPQAWNDRRWWTDKLQNFNGKQCHLPKPTLTIATDASDFGWGAYLIDGQTLKEAIRG